MVINWNENKNLKTAPKKKNKFLIFIPKLLSICNVPNIHETKIIPWEISVCGHEQGLEIHSETRNLYCLLPYSSYHSRDFHSAKYYPSTKTQFRHKISVVLPSLHKQGYFCLLNILLWWSWSVHCTYVHCLFPHENVDFMRKWLLSEISEVPGILQPLIMFV